MTHVAHLGALVVVVCELFELWFRLTVVERTSVDVVPRSVVAICSLYIARS